MRLLEVQGRNQGANPYSSDAAEATVVSQTEDILYLSCAKSKPRNAINVPVKKIRRAKLSIMPE